MACDAIPLAAHPDDLEVSMGGTAAGLVAAGLRVLFLDFSNGEPAARTPLVETPLVFDAVRFG